MIAPLESNMQMEGSALIIDVLDHRLGRKPSKP